jgi:hypothetical protein
MASRIIREDEMRSLVSAWRSSGQSHKAFSAAHNINIHTFKYWVDRIAYLDSHERVGDCLESGGVTSTPLPKGFVAIQSPLTGNKAESEVCLEIRFPHGAVLQLSGQNGILSTSTLELVKALVY